jgi:hypothetical protein
VTPTPKAATNLTAAGEGDGSGGSRRSTPVVMAARRDRCAEQ